MMVVANVAGFQETPCGALVRGPLTKKAGRPRSAPAPEAEAAAATAAPVARSLLEEFEAELGAAGAGTAVAAAGAAGGAQEAVEELRRMCREEDEKRRAEFKQKFDFDLREERPVEGGRWRWTPLG